MDALFNLLSATPIGPGPALSVLVFAAVAMLAFGAMASVRVRGDIKRRAAGVRIAGAPDERGSLRFASHKTAQKVTERINRHFSGEVAGAGRLLKNQLIQAGFLHPRAGMLYFLARTAAALGFGAVALVVIPTLLPTQAQTAWLLVWLSACAGYLAPKLYLDRRIAKRREQHRSGFPDFMDLLVVCANAGLSMEAALDRVGRELSDSYPSLSTNLYMTNLELRAGRTLGEALEHLADRLGLEEARALATLLQQSQELGSSLTDALRVYSEDMRHKRMSTAEEKAYSLPAKLSVPLILCIFPVIIIVVMLPVFVRVKFALY